MKIPHRGLTLLELMIAMSLTAMIGAGIVGILNATASSLARDGDQRSMIIGAGISQSRLAALLVPSCAMLDIDETACVAWTTDRRDPGLVNASELVWLRFLPEQGIVMSHLEFPDTWDERTLLREDPPLKEDADLEQILIHARGRGLVQEVPFIDGLDGVTFGSDAPPPLSRHVCLELDFNNNGSMADPVVQVWATIDRPVAPGYP